MGVALLCERRLVGREPFRDGGCSRFELHRACFGIRETLLEIGFGLACPLELRLGIGKLVREFGYPSIELGRSRAFAFELRRCGVAFALCCLELALDDMQPVACLGVSLTLLDQSRIGSSDAISLRRQLSFEFDDAALNDLELPLEIGFGLACPLELRLGIGKLVREFGYPSIELGRSRAFAFELRRCGVAFALCCLELALDDMQPVACLGVSLTLPDQRRIGSSDAISLRRQLSFEFDDAALNDLELPLEIGFGLACPLELRLSIGKLIRQFGYPSIELGRSRAFAFELRRCGVAFALCCLELAGSTTCNRSRVWA